MCCVRTIAISATVAVRVRKRVAGWHCLAGEHRRLINKVPSHRAGLSTAQIMQQDAVRGEMPLVVLHLPSGDPRASQLDQPEGGKVLLAM
jgi:hypothetical protein